MPSETEKQLIKSLPFQTVYESYLKSYQYLVFKILGFERFGIIKLILFESVLIFVPIIFGARLLR